MTKVGLVAALLACASPAAAFNFETAVSDGCHEHITLDALAIAGWPEGRSPPAPSERDRRALDDAPFTIPERLRDGWTLALLVGVRDNDLRGRAADDLPGLAEVHNDRDGQAAHCLRSPGDDGPAGDVSALAACRAFIRAELDLALGVAEALDLETTEATPVALAFSGRVDLPVRRFAFHVGRALHALQDSYTHTLRNSDFSRIEHVLNFVDPARSHHYDEARDGLVHLAELDLCEGVGERQRNRVAEATRASAELLAALASPEGGRAGRLRRVEAVLDRRLAPVAGCTRDNDYCGDPEAVPSCATTGAGAGVALVVLVVLVGRRRPRRILSMVAVSLSLAVMPRAAHAHDAGTATATSALLKPTSHNTGEVSLQLAVSGALDQAALAGTFGVRWQFSDDLTIGADAEYNPWISLSAGRFAPGALNGYATLVYRWWSIGEVDLTLTAHLGVSVLLFDLVNASAGSVGPYLGLNLLGVSIHLSDRLRLVLDPADLSLPIPSLGGVPFVYQQYRLTVGLTWSP